MTLLCKRDWCGNCKHCMVELWKIDGMTVVYRCDCRDDPYEDFDPNVSRICDKWEERK